MKRAREALAIIMLALMIAGCGREANQVSYNISQQADNFNVMRRLTVINTRTDKVLFRMSGRFSVQKEDDGDLAVIVEIDRKKNRYQKHIVDLNDWITYVVEDLNGVEVSRYDYELEFMPQMRIPVKINADELGQDCVETAEPIGEAEEETTDGE